MTNNRVVKIALPGFHMHLQMFQSPVVHGPADQPYALSPCGYNRELIDAPTTRCAGEE